MDWANFDFAQGCKQEFRKSTFLGSGRCWLLRALFEEEIDCGGCLYALPTFVPLCAAGATKHEYRSKA